ncbi:hypothetical protein RM407_001521 [Enterobacter kobei]|nr:hypothetical protein [Enterobacter kobei]
MLQRITVELKKECNVADAKERLKNICTSLNIKAYPCIGKTASTSLRDKLSRRKLNSDDKNKSQNVIANLERKLHIYYDPTQKTEKEIQLNLQKTNEVLSVKPSTLVPSGSTFLSLSTEPSLNTNFFDNYSLFLRPFGSDHLYGWNLESGNGYGRNCFILDVEITPNDDIPVNIYKDAANPGTHGTYVATIIGARNNNEGYIGIVPECNLYFADESFNYDQVFIYGNEGDVVNLSIAHIANGFTAPIIGDPEMRDYMYLAYLLGITSCYASGNSSVNLDDIYVAGEGYIYNKNSSDYVGSYGICVGGGQEQYLEWKRNLNYGSMVDVFSISSFAGSQGTSFAAPRITGLVAQLQSIYFAKKGVFLDPLQVRDIISSPETGIKPAHSVSETDNAVMPVLKDILIKLGISSPVDYPENYGVNQNDIDVLTGNINNLFADESHTSLGQDISTNDLIDLDSLLRKLARCQAKIDLTKEFLKAAELLSERELPFVANFSTNPKNWVYNGAVENIDENGLTLVNNGSRVIGALMMHDVIPLAFDKIYRLSLTAEVITAEDNPTLTLGHYLPGADYIVSPDLIITSPVSKGENTISLTFNSGSMLYSQNFPGFGFKNVNSVLLKELILESIN